MKQRTEIRSVMGVKTAGSMLLLDTRLPIVFNRDSAPITTRATFNVVSGILARSRPDFISAMLRKTAFSAIETPSKATNWERLVSLPPQTIV